MNVEPCDAVGLIGPRLLALITTKSSDGSINASPYSWIFPFSFNPPLVAVGVGKGGKATQINAEREKEFVINLVSVDFAQKACRLEALHGPRQLERAGLHAVESKKVKAMGIGEARVRIECRLAETVNVKQGDHVFIVGKIVAAECLAMKGAFQDLDRLELLMHLSGSEFRKVGEKIELERERKIK